MIKKSSSFLILILLLVLQIGCKPAEDFTEEEVLRQLPPPAPYSPPSPPFSNESLIVDNQTSGMDFNAINFLGGPTPTENTLAFWIRLDSNSSTTGGSIVAMDPASECEYDISMNGTIIDFHFRETNYGPVTDHNLTFDLAEKDTWFHVAAVFNSQDAATEDIFLYVNGQLVDSKIIGPTPFFNLLIARTLTFFPNSDQPQGFSLDEMVFFRQALLPAEIVELYNQGSPSDLNAFPVPFDNWWRLGENDSSNSQLEDESGLFPILSSIGTTVSFNNFAADYDPTLPPYSGPIPGSGQNTDPFNNPDQPSDPLTNGEADSNTSGGTGSDPLAGGSNGYGGELGNGSSGGGTFP